MADLRAEHGLPTRIRPVHEAYVAPPVPLEGDVWLSAATAEPYQFRGGTWHPVFDATPADERESYRAIPGASPAQLRRYGELEGVGWRVEPDKLGRTEYVWVRLEDGSTVQLDRMGRTV